MIKDNYTHVTCRDCKWVGKTEELHTSYDDDDGENIPRYCPGYGCPNITIFNFNKDGLTVEDFLLTKNRWKLLVIL